ncbi:MAG TPA: hypothetical protein VJN93_01270 [Candidatus Acidoferrum sp.]|nr:hypothetical protein [Candidatus Acidoferrum sp.]
MLSPPRVHVLSELRRTNLELADLEVPAFIVSVFLTLKSWSASYSDLISVNRFRVPIQQRLALLGAPVVSLAFIFVTLTKLASSDVRRDPLYLAFYLLIGAAWMGGGTLLFPFLGISARDDILERGNGASVWAIAGALAGISCSFAGGNVGNGPGVAAVLSSAVLSTGLFFVLWFVLDVLTSISDAITIDREKGAGIRMAGFLVGLGLLSGWSVAGDWVSAPSTLKDFLHSSWPAVAITAIGVFLELALKRVSIRFSSRISVSAVVSAAYIGLGLAWIVIRGVHS